MDTLIHGWHCDPWHHTHENKPPTKKSWKNPPYAEVSVQNDHFPSLRRSGDERFLKIWSNSQHQRAHVQVYCTPFPHTRFCWKRGQSRKQMTFWVDVLLLTPFLALFLVSRSSLVDILLPVKNVCTAKSIHCLLHFKSTFKCSLL